MHGLGRERSEDMHAEPHFGRSEIAGRRQYLTDTVIITFLRQSPRSRKRIYSNTSKTKKQSLYEKLTTFNLPRQLSIRSVKIQQGLTYGNETSVCGFGISKKSKTEIQTKQDQSNRWNIKNETDPGKSLKSSSQKQAIRCVTTLTEIKQTLIFQYHQDRQRVFMQSPLSSLIFFLEFIIDPKYWNWTEPQVKIKKHLRRFGTCQESNKNHLEKQGYLRCTHMKSGNAPG